MKASRRAKVTGAQLSSAGTLALMVGATALLAAPVMAQTQTESAAPERAGTLEEIVVTSRRYEESVQDAPVAVNVLTSSEISDRRIQTIDEILQVSPGAVFTFFNKVNPEASVRGLQTATGGNAAAESGVLSVFDDVVIAQDFMRASPIFDVGRVEVLKGPQGTSFGRNASIGVVHIVSNRPTEEFEAGATATIGNNQRYETDGYLSGPLTDTLSARLAYNFDSYDGDQESISTGKGLDGTENFAVRGLLLYEPNSDLSVLFKAEYFEDNDEAPVRRSADCSVPQILGVGDPRRGTEFIVPFMPPFAQSFTDPCDPFKTEISEGNFFFKREMLSLSANINWAMTDDVSLTSITGYREGKSHGFQDAFGTPANILFQETTNNGEAFTQELRIDNQASASRLRWLGGLFFLRGEEDRLEQNNFFARNADGSTTLAGPNPRDGTFIRAVQFNETTSFAAFGELTYDLTERLTATLGARWGRDEKDATISTRGFGFQPVIAGLAGCTTFPVCGTPTNPAGFDPVDLNDDWNDLMFKGSLQYQVTDDQMVYFLGSQGFKSGGFQSDPRTPADAALPFNPERTLNFELGWKGEIGGQFRYALTGFFIKLDNTQLNQFIAAGQGFFQVIANAGRVESFGIEGDIVWSPTANFRIGGNFALLETEFKDTAIRLGSGAEPVDLSGTRPDAATPWTATAYAEYDIDFQDGSSLTLRGDFIGRGNAFDDVGEDPTRKRPTLTNIGARTTWTSADRRWDFALWGRNLTEDEDLVNIGPNTPNSLQPAAQIGLKRQYGATLSFRY